MEGTGAQEFQTTNTAFFIAQAIPNGTKMLFSANIVLSRISVMWIYLFLIFFDGDLFEGACEIM